MMRTLRMVLFFLMFLVIGALLGYGHVGTLQSACKGAGVAGVMFVICLVFF